MSQANAADIAGECVGDEAVQQRLCVGPCDLDLGEGADIHNAHALAHGTVLLTHALVNDIATKAVVIFLRLVTGGEPARAFVAIDLFKDCPLFLESLVERARFHRPAVQAIEVGEGDLVAEQVVFSRLDVLPLFVGVVAESARVKGAHRHIGRAMHHPAGQFTGQARTPANANLRAAAAPIIAHARCGAN